MVNAGRIACIFTPFVLSIGALATLVLVFLAGEFNHNKTLDDFYFLKVSQLIPIRKQSPSNSSSRSTSQTSHQPSRPTSPPMIL